MSLANERDSSAANPCSIRRLHFLAETGSSHRVAGGADGRMFLQGPWTGCIICKWT